MSARLGWFEIFRVGLVQAALGAIVVLTTSTLNRVMVVELALPALVPGLLVTLHHAVQILRPRFGHGSDVGGRRTPWVIGGMAVLAVGGILAAVATTMLANPDYWAYLVATLAFGMIGAGAGAAGTSLLALLAKAVSPVRRSQAATIVWLMMIAGFAITATLAGHWLEPYSPERLVQVAVWISGLAFLVSVVAIWGVEPRVELDTARTSRSESDTRFTDALKSVWQEQQARVFTIFVFVSMLAYSMQDLILEPFAGAAFGMTPGQSTALSGVQHGGVFAGMLLVALLARTGSSGGHPVMQPWVVGGCVASAGALFALAGASALAPHLPLSVLVFILGLTNGSFAVAAIASMMELAGEANGERAGMRMGLWGGAQAVAFGSGGFLGAVASDLLGRALGSQIIAYAVVFTVEGLMFLIAARIAIQVLPAGRRFLDTHMNSELKGRA